MGSEGVQGADIALPAALSLHRLRELCHMPANDCGWCGCELEEWFSTEWEASQSDPNLTKPTRVNGELLPRALRYRGTLLTRISQHAHARGSELSKAYLSELGNLLQREMDAGVVWHVDFINLKAYRDIPWHAGAFGDEKSCYWGSKSEARKILCWYGAWAVRVYDAAGYGIGRAWLLSITRGQLTTMADAEGLVVWNGYLPSVHVDSETKTIARVLQKFCNVETVARVILTNDADSDLYINASGAYWVGASATAPHDICLDWCNISWRECASCGAVIGPVSAHPNYCRMCYRS